MEYKVIDTMSGMSLERGDMILSPSGEPIVISEIIETDSGYRIYHLDIYEDDIEHFDISDDDFVKLLAPE